MRLLYSLIVLSALTAFATGLPHPARGGELRMAIHSEPKSLDPHLASEADSELVAYLTHGVLIRIDRQTQRPQAELAASWKVRPDGKEIRFLLRPGLKFSDGSALAASDVCFSIQRILDPALDSPFGDSLRAASGKIRCTATGASVSISFERALPSPERWWDSIAILKEAAPVQDRVGLGPFTVAEWQSGTQILLRRNERYWKKDAAGRNLPYLDAIRLQIQRNREVELLRFSRGELDLIQGLDAERYTRLQEQQPQALRGLGASLDSEQMWFNQVPQSPLPAYKKSWYANPAFRQGISAAIHREDLAKVVYKGQATPATGPISPMNRAWAHPALLPQPGDPHKALSLLGAAGFQKTGDTLYDSEQHPVEFTVLTNAGNKNRERMLSLIQQDLLAIGVKLKPVTLDFPALIERITKTYDYDACLLGMVIGNPDPNEFLNVLMSSAATHQWNPNQKTPATPWEAEIDSLLQAQAGEPDVAKRKKAWWRIQEILATQQPFLYLVHPNAMAAVASRVQGIRPVVLRPQLLWNAEWLSLDPQ
ncbi:ABC transporter substrate-binding protein [Bryobacter aggregatus]|uniref:ABC transporter substrate-binding protein n=1 Tax=Bryobacter aggregatus TaxID=360054 RepID=UPI0004E25776|nr:ABC transporter substrate-binding protein [Bryobacter aggregatus]